LHPQLNSKSHIENTTTMPPSNDVGSPSTAVTNAIIGRKRGTRSNVAVVVSQKRTSDLEDPESFFRNATSAAASPADMAAGDKPLMDIATGKTPNNRVGGRRSNHPRRSLPGQSKENNDMEVQPSKASTRALQAAKEGRLSHISPSDLSLVSTAPPTPASVAAGLKHAGENESPMVTQPVDEEETEEEEEEPTTTTVTLQHQDHITETTRMSHDDNDQDEGDEMIPQPPQEFEQEDDFAVMPNDDDDDDHHHDEGTGFELNNDNSDSQSDVGLPSEIDAEEVSPKKLHSTLKTPGSTKKSVDTDDDDDDNKNDKEDDKANMVHDPETPESVRKERVRREEKHMERKMKARKQNNELSDTETPAKRGRKKKKQRVAFQFSPEGYPIAPREYSSVPVSDLKETPPEGVRRSGRAHHKPLQFWKNERPIYEPHNENGDLGEAMGNMPVVAAYQTALPTPRKKRSVPDSTSGKNDRKGRRHPANDCASAAMDATPFNATKLKRKYHYLDGEEALVYDDATDTVKEDCKWMIMVLFCIGFIVMVFNPF